MEDKYFNSGKKMPVVLVYGMDPLTFLVSGTEVPYGVNELNYIGAIRKESVPVVKGLATGLPIPAYAEIAVEGFLEPDKMREEGPFGEWTGYYASGRRLEPYIKVLNLYYRNDPILLGFPPSKGSYCSYGYFRSVYRSALIYDQLERLGLPGLKGVWAPEVGGSRMLVIVSIKQLYHGHATEAAFLASQIREGAYAGRFVIVVDDDINPYDIEDVLWAMCTRANPAEDIDVIRKTWSTPLDPRIRKPTDDYTSSVAIIKAVKPYSWIKEFPKTAVEDEGKRKEVFKKYKELLGWESW
jgi:4-hydroxy-3-polyprenylbenzoate decarboxylase